MPALLVVHRRHSRVARGVAVVTSLVGAVIYALAALWHPPAAVLALAYLGHAVPLVQATVREHVGVRP